MDVRDRLLNAALKVFQEAGTRGATTRRIAGEAGVNEITLFRHFGSKAALMQQALRLAASHTEQLGLPAEPVDPEAELGGWVHAHLAHLRGARSMIRTAMGEFEQAPEMGRCVVDGPVAVVRELEGYLARLAARGMADRELDVEAAAAMLMGAMFGDAMGRDVAPSRFPFTAEEAGERYLRFFLRAIGAAGRDGRDGAVAAEGGRRSNNGHVTG
jgi:AcrR family transcriptional regulator